MYMKNWEIVIGFVFFIISCSERQDTFDSFKSELIYSKRLNISDSIGFSADLLFVNDFLVVSEYEGLDYFKIIDIKSDIVVKKFGKIGEGPCEIKLHSNIQKVGTSSIGVYVRPDFNYVEYNLENLDSLYCHNETNEFDFNFQKLVNLDKGRFLGVGLFNGRYVLTNNKNYRIDSVFLDYPFDNELNISFEEKAMLFQGDFTIQPLIYRVAFATRSFEALDIFSFDGKEMEVINRISGNKLPAFSSENDGTTISANLSESNIWGYLSVSSSNSHIYLLYSGKRTDDDFQKSNIVLVYDWEGNPIREIVLDQEVSIIAVNETGKNLVGYLDDGRSNFYLFDL